MDLETGLPSYPDKFFDLAIVDPPYGIGLSGYKTAPKTFFGNKSPVSKNGSNFTKKGWDKNRPNEEYFFQLKRVCKNVIVWGGNYFTDFFPPSKGWVFWYKRTNGNFADGEMAYTSFDRPLKVADFVWNGLQQADMKYKEKRIHPTQKPVALYRWLLENYAKPGQLILDTHVGSASSLIACESMGFDYVGFEIDPDYYAAAKNRMNKGIQAVLI